MACDRFVARETDLERAEAFVTLCSMFEGLAGAELVELEDGGARLSLWAMKGAFVGSFDETKLRLSCRSAIDMTHAAVAALDGAGVLDRWLTVALCDLLTDLSGD